MLIWGSQRKIKKWTFSLNLKIYQITNSFYKSKIPIFLKLDGNQILFIVMGSFLFHIIYKFLSNSKILWIVPYNTKDFDNITVRAGGGSAIYGSSAMGGSIHLNNELIFKNQFQNELFLSYGSFNTFGGNYKVNAIPNHGGLLRCRSSEWRWWHHS